MAEQQTAFKSNAHPPVDGKMELKIGERQSKVTLFIIPPLYGGKSVTKQMLADEMKVRNIRYGIDYPLIDKIFEDNLFNKLHVIAQWTPPVNGIDGTLTYKVAQAVEIKPKENEKGFVDYKDLGIIRNISQGEVIGEITLPTDGTPGTDVNGNAVMQRKGVPANIPMGENIGVSGDGTQLMATQNGHLIFKNGKFHVETVFNLPGDVDASVGNLDFTGDIIIRGEVLEGFKVSSMKNVTVYGNVVGARIEASGDIIIKKGCINSTIISHKNVSVGFVENSNISCDGNLKGDAFITSHVYCGGTLDAVGSKGILMGGKYTCLKNLTASSIGTKSFTKTIVIVGDNAVMVEEKEDIIKKLADIETRLLTCNQSIDFLNEKKKEFGFLPDKKAELLQIMTKQKILNQIEKSKMEKRITEIDKYLQEKEDLSITCRKQLYPGVKITINDLVYNVNTTINYCKIHLVDGEIKVDML